MKNPPLTETVSEQHSIINIYKISCTWWLILINRYDAHKMSSNRKTLIDYSTNQSNLSKMFLRTVKFIKILILRDSPWKSWQKKVLFSFQYWNLQSQSLPVACILQVHIWSFKWENCVIRLHHNFRKRSHNKRSS